MYAGVFTFVQGLEIVLVSSTAAVDEWFTLSRGRVKGVPSEERQAVPRVLRLEALRQENYGGGGGRWRRGRGRSCSRSRQFSLNHGRCLRGKN